MKKFLLKFLVTLAFSITLILFNAAITFADFDPLDCLVDVYTDENNVHWTIYDLSLIPANAVFGDDNNSIQKSTQNKLLTSQFSKIEEFNIDYSYSEVNDIHYIDATCSFSNNTGDDQNVTFLAVLYDGSRMVRMISDAEYVDNGNDGNLSLSLALTDATEDSYVKLFVWESFQTLRPLYITRTVQDIVSVSSEKVTFITKASGQDFNIYLSTSENKSINGKIHTVIYDPAKFQLVDLCSLTKEKETSACEIERLGLNFTSVTNGEIKFTIINNQPDNTRLNAIVNAISFKTLANVSDEQIQYTVE